MDVRFPIGEFQPPENPTLVDVKQWMSEIEVYINHLKETVTDLNEAQLKKQYREGSWTVNQLVHHIADSQINLYERLKMALTSDGVTAFMFDQTRWVELPDSFLPVDISVNILEGLNKRIVEMGNHVTNEDLSRKITLSDGSDVTVAELLKKLSWHERHHLEHIKIALSN
ncbi:YfiT family bacillithiol transferase [Staphylococcus caledonicus]|uniref:YfiT family bacillithiol transferase n=1 Tax=Staphylococcus caledonicus TaxID=2741333 RepID=UPI0018E48100|nr:putative metal-dependent hydrolase [Staphylococcus caledonicus]MBI5973586.1 putative metal-dependent hydrolase [Staphylococcus caledonicus]